MLTFGEAKFRTSAPDDLDALLVELTGCDATEVARMLEGEPFANFVARAAMPFVVGVVMLHELTEAIAKAGSKEAAEEVLTLYRKLREPGDE